MDKLILDMKKWNRINYYENLVLLILAIMAFLMSIYLYEKIIFDDDTGLPPYLIVINILVVLIVAALTISFIIKKRNKRTSLLFNGKIVTANFSKNEFRFGFTRYYHTYNIVGYFVEGNHTYMFNAKVIDHSVYSLKIFNEIIKRGKFPPIPVLVEESNYNNYEMKVYEFLDETLKINKDIVDDIRYH